MRSAARARLRREGAVARYEEGWRPVATAGVGGGSDARVIVLVRANCPSCVRMEGVVREVCERTGDRWARVDVGAPDVDPELRAEFADSVPVTLVDGNEIATWSLAPDVLTAVLGARA